MPIPLPRFLIAFVVAVAATLAATQPAAAQVQVSFHSFNGSMLVGRYPHTFVVFDGTLQETGARINENFGFTAKKIGPAILNGPVEHAIWVEEEKWIGRTNRHFTLDVDDATYRRMRAEVEAWRNAPGKFYDLDNRNCIHFVGKLAQMAGLTVDYPKNLLRKPRAWLNRVTSLNPQLGARAIGG